jgi:hypothetical protein
MVTFQFVPYCEIESLGSAKRVNKLINIVKDNKIVIMEGRLTKQEEADLIEITMEEIGARFKGIELSVIYPERKNATGLKWVRNTVIDALLGDRQGLTVIGPASIVKRIEQNPDTIELFTRERKNARRRKRKRR